MFRTVRFGAPALAILLALAGCGGKSGTSGVVGPGGGGSGGGGGGGGTGSAPMTAKIDGVDWAATPLTSGQGVQLVTPGNYVVTGYHTVGTTSFLVLTLYNIAGPGTYPMGVGGTTFGGSASVGDVSHAWNTPLSGSAGTVTVTTLTASRIAGTFAFVASVPVLSATGTRTVTEGAFDFPVFGSPGPLADNAGSRLSCTIDGVPWNGATVVEAATGPDSTRTTVLGALSDDRHFSFSLTGPLAAGSDYALSNVPPLTMLLMNTTSPALGWGGSVSIGAGGTTLVTNDTGTVHISSHTATRLAGTFSGSLAPASVSPGPGNVTITDGQFDIGLQAVAQAPPAWLGLR